MCTTPIWWLFLLKNVYWIDINIVYNEEESLKWHLSQQNQTVCSNIDTMKTTTINQPTKKKQHFNNNSINENMIITLTWKFCISIQQSRLYVQLEGSSTTRPHALDKFLDLFTQSHDSFMYEQTKIQNRGRDLFIIIFILFFILMDGVLKSS